MYDKTKYIYVGLDLHKEQQTGEFKDTSYPSEEPTA